MVSVTLWNPSKGLKRPVPKEVHLPLLWSVCPNDTPTRLYPHLYQTVAVTTPHVYEDSQRDCFH